MFLSNRGNNYLKRDVQFLAFVLIAVIITAIMIVITKQSLQIPFAVAAGTPAGYWNFDETSGTSAADSSGNVFTGTLVNGVTWTSAGKVNGALNFDGVDDYVSIALPAYNFTGNFSMSVWLKTSVAGSIMGFTGALPKNGAHDKELFIDTAGKVNFRLYPQGTLRSNLTVSDGSWHHLAATYATDASMKIYADGTIDATNPTQGNSASYGGYFTIGIQGQDYGYFNGIIDEVKIFNYALSAAEVSSLYSVSNGGGSGTVSPQGASVPAGTPDLDVTYIERLPRYQRYHVQYGASGPTGISNPGQKDPGAGEAVTFIAHVKNKGDGASGNFSFAWKINDAPVYSGIAPSLAGGGAEQTVSYSWQWQTDKDYEVEFVVDPSNAISENYEQNNSLKIKTNSYYLRIQVEQEVYDNFNFLTNVAGTKSFEDWIQAQFAEINRMFARQGGGTEARVRIDQISIEPNDTLPDGGTHAAENWDWDGSWGFERTGWTLNEISAWVGRIQYTLIHELNHQLGIIDAYNLNYDWNYVKGNEIIPICASFDITKMHTVAGYAEPYKICTYMNDKYQSIMRGGSYPENQEYSTFEIGAINATKGYRRGYFGEYLFDVPANNFLRFMNNDQPVSGLAVEAYQATNVSIKLENKIYTGITDSAGKIALPNRSVSSLPITLTGHQLKPNPFGDINVVGLNGILLLKLSNGSAIDYKYIDISEFNVAYWSGNKENATYNISTALTMAPSSDTSTSTSTPSSANSNPNPSSSAPSSSDAGNNGGSQITSGSSGTTAPAGTNATSTSSDEPANQKLLSDADVLHASNQEASPVAAARQLINAPSAQVETVSQAEAEVITSRQERVVLNATTSAIYQKITLASVAGMAEAAKIAIAYFIHYGTPTTQILGAGERGGVVNSFYTAYQKMPQSDTDWQDAVKIANGRWPSQRNQAAENAATATFKRIYLRAPHRSNPHDDAAVTVMAYGLRPASRNLNSEKAAIKIFKAIFGKNPNTAANWDAVRAIAYSGATR